MNKKLNGYAKWILIAIAITTLVYNTIATHVIAKNDIFHLQKAVERIEKKMDELNTRFYEYIIKDK